MAVSTKIRLNLVSTLTGSLDLSTPVSETVKKFAYDWANGTAINQADRVFADERTLAPSGTEDLDLVGTLTDGLGTTFSPARIKAMIFYSLAANTNNITIGGTAATQFASWCGAATHTITLRPGGLIAFIAPDATGYACAAGSTDLLKILNASGGTSVTYGVILVGASA
jgi:hypothetical protein